MPPLQVVLDTNVLVAALRSNRGASFRLLSLLESGGFQIHLSVPLVVEYEDVLQRQREALGLTRQDVGDLLDYLCRVAELHEVYYLWLPLLPDPQDEMIVQLAVTAGCQYIVTYNRADFAGVDRFGIRAVTSRELLEIMGEV
jgi:putative PIN family toxin of toxin-antitoxin system